MAHARPWGTSLCQPPLTLSVPWWRAWGSPGNISKEIGEFSWTSLTSLREANASLKEELKVAHAEGDAKDRRIVDLEAKLAEATSSAHAWHLPLVDARIPNLVLA